ncbi:hypothetical protein [uncultured Vagococcus sp.]|uniref:hypothetical protein n=1 Tax=uncultured Vagococcus sp. TaxID=189676 RepID=UPI002582C067|nr:hypothetical protein [uncultured Vagococcus sp.]
MIVWALFDSGNGFEIPYENLTYYNNYDYPISKPTKFKSNLDLNLSKIKIPNEVEFNRTGWSYNERSNIPGKLVDEIFEKVIKENKHENTRQYSNENSRQSQR